MTDTPLDDLTEDDEDPATMKRRAVKLAGHRTSLSIENAFWQTFKDICATDEVSVAHRITEIDETRTGNLSSAVRIHVLQRLLDEMEDLQAILHGEVDFEEEDNEEEN